MLRRGFPDAADERIEALLPRFLELYSQSIAQHTRHLGLVCTSTSTYDQPYLLARRFASLDLVSGGRAGWNLVTSGNKYEAQGFGFAEHVDKATRYRRAREFAHVVRGLWNSWGDGALVRAQTERAPMP